jgi:hypothetical protein
MSATAIPQGTGPSSASPLSHTKPDRLCANRSWPGRSIPWTINPITSDAAVNDARIDRGNGLVTEADAIDYARPEILNENVGAFDELAHLA